MDQLNFFEPALFFMKIILKYLHPYHGLRYDGLDQACMEDSKTWIKVYLANECTSTVCFIYIYYLYCLVGCFIHLFGPPGGQHARSTILT